jgi:hypothetical protein
MSVRLDSLSAGNPIFFDAENKDTFNQKGTFCFKVPF